MRGTHFARWFAAAAVLSAAGIAMVPIAGQLTGIPFGYFTRDPLVVLTWDYYGAGNRWYAGFLNQVGVVVIVMGAAAALVTWLAARGMNASGRSHELLLPVGMLLLVFGLDDLLMLHERALSNVLGLKEEWVFAVYLACGISILIRYWRQLLADGYVWFLAIAGGLLAMSLGFDELLPLLDAESAFTEDAPKFVGYVFAATYCAAAGIREVESAAAAWTGHSPMVAADDSAD